MLPGSSALGNLRVSTPSASLAETFSGLIARGSKTVRMKLALPVNARSTDSWFGAWPCFAMLVVLDAAKYRVSISATNTYSVKVLTVSFARRGLSSLLRALRRRRLILNDASFDGDAPAGAIDAHFHILLFNPWQFGFYDVMLPVVSEVDGGTNSGPKERVVKQEGPRRGACSRQDWVAAEGLLQHTEEGTELAQERSCERHGVTVGNLMLQVGLMARRENYICLRSKDDVTFPEQSRDGWRDLVILRHSHGKSRILSGAHTHWQIFLDYHNSTSIWLRSGSEETLSNFLNLASLSSSAITF
jgi:hypothetical protein